MYSASAPRQSCRARKCLSATQDYAGGGILVIDDGMDPAEFGRPKLARSAKTGRVECTKGESVAPQVRGRIGWTLRDPTPESPGWPGDYVAGSFGTWQPGTSGNVSLDPEDFEGDRSFPVGASVPTIAVLVTQTSSSNLCWCIFLYALRTPMPRSRAVLD